MHIPTRNKSLLMVAGALLALALLAACGDDDDYDGNAGSSQSMSHESGGGLDSDSSTGGDPAESPSSVGAGDGEARGVLDASLGVRKIIFTSNVALDVEDVTASFQTVGQIAAGAGGFVESSDLSRRNGLDGEVHEFASVTIRVPSTQYGDVLAQLRSLAGATVTHEDSRSTEVTEEYSDLTSRIRNLERTENRYLLLLEEADSIADILTVTDRIDGVRLQIEQLQGRLNLLDDLVDLATIHVSLDPIISTVSVVEESGSTSPIDAFGDAWDLSLAVAGRGLIVLAYAAVGLLWVGPLLLIGAIVFAIRGRGATGAAQG